VNDGERFADLLERKFLQSGAPVLFIKGGLAGTGPLEHWRSIFMSAENNRQRHHLGGHSLPGSQSGFFLRFSMWHLPQRWHTFQEFPRVAPISRALPLSVPVLN
jgi:hypothetical protein